MQRQNLRVIVASEYPKVQYFLRDVVEEEAGAVIVGQAENATKALTLARNLRPDIAIIDCYLPYAVGLDTLPPSRIGGLDTAQTISQEIPNTRVILLNNLDTEVLPEHVLGSGVMAFFSRKTNRSNIPFTLQELYQEAEPLSSFVFANVNVQTRATLRQKVADLSDKAILFGGLGILGGLALILTAILAGAGVFLAAAGAAAMFLGLAGKLATTLWTKTPRLRPRLKEVARKLR